ncbi:hypothetical protein F5Y01DRAFT_23868 [Xylaria sp. FL0043]|nr:hypothetical protein F5Y01DRAFT_23868 [Xylaria sp. FL0043]
MDLKSATTRLRRTFAYPSDATTTSPSSYDSDSDGGPALDEQEQEELIQSLVQQNAKRNAQFRLFLLALPAISTLPYLLVLFSSLSILISRDGSSRNNNPGEGGVKGRSTATDIWIALLALSSLASTAWMLWSLPPGVTGIRALDAWVGSADTTSSPSSTSSSSSSSSRHQQRQQQQQPGLLGPIGANAQRRRRASAAGSRFFFWAQHHRSPLQQYLPFLNMAICALLVLTGVLSSQRSAAAVRHWGHVGLANLPALIYVVVLVGKMLMGSVDPEKELSGLRYEYKGA